MLADQVGGDPVQPGPGIGVAEVIPVPLGESRQERLGDQVISNLAASTPGQVPVNVRGMPVEQDCEPLRLQPGTLNDRSIIGGGSAAPPHPPPSFMPISFRVPQAKHLIHGDPSGSSGGYICYPQLAPNMFTVIAVSSLEDAITLTDDLPYGLMASIYTADAGTGLRYADAVQAAWVNVNESSNYWETHLPFGGGGGSASGVGRVGGRYAMEALSQVRTVVLSGLA
jgi:hypothetical protein